ncbi:Transient receptor potential cation channel subfamily V member 6 [Tetrabaena socialis]|uniref:Transient receptor potential cation channel subfamily V member 6 n=1 Tax=Tetrabaena socialis TaxID=47790 RepID=A0A2J8ABK1_9CHLO|nr:Transient receptor potential cation channel subfamily V member 6 [Tetrabaena socialis]|eukprot:PNH09877.1 Transient receptor potential cation channel subfamily V member 6 [Tetrabaena socialis]
MSELRGVVSARKAAHNAALTAAKSNVVQQAKLMDSAGTAWHAVKYGNLEMITRLFPSQCNVYNKGPVGENVFHIAMLLNTPSTLAIAKYLVKLYGKTLVNTPYQERKTETDPAGLYEGETALHIAIVNHDFDMVKFLVQNGADVRARAYGSFFQPGSAVYYGEYPLSFAACTGQKDIVSYLKRHGARVNHDRDQCGGRSAARQAQQHAAAVMGSAVAGFGSGGSNCSGGSSGGGSSGGGRSGGGAWRERRFACSGNGRSGGGAWRERWYACSDGVVWR